MSHVKILVGLCGCGKSHVAQDLEAREGYVCLDEEFAGKRFTADTGVLSRGKFDTLVRLLKEGKDCAYTDATLMCKATREQFDPWLQELQALPGVIVEWVFFENDIGAANHNCINDPNRMDGKGRANLNNDWTKHYTIPAGHTPRPIVKVREKAAGSKPSERASGQVVRGLP